jgi:acyclic terpene utilization AtuA family protein
VGCDARTFRPEGYRVQSQEGVKVGIKVTEVLRIANCSGFYGDRFAAAREMLEGGPIDVLTGEYLAELTMLILWKARLKDPEAGYATTFLRQMEEVAGLAIDRGVKIVVNAGGLNPAGLASKLHELLQRLGLRATVAHIEGDDLMPRLGELQAAGNELRHLDTGRSIEEAGIEPVSANAYLGAWGIVEALHAGADIVVCPRVTDASLVVGPAAWRFGWARDDWDRLAGAVVAGHIVECGAQATGGNYSFFSEVPGIVHLGFPIAELRQDGTAVITKHPGTGGVVSVGTVTAQLLYEIQGRRYLNPDVVTRFDSVILAPDGPDRVLVSGVRGEPAPDTLKVSINYVGGYRNAMTFVLTGLDIQAKAEVARRQLFESVGGEAAFDDVDVQLVRYADAMAQLRVTVKDRDAKKVGRAFSNKAIELALASYPGFFTTSPPEAEAAYGVYWPALVPAQLVEQAVVLEDGRRLEVVEPPRQPAAGEAPEPGDGRVPDLGPTRRLPLGTVFGARSGDKGGNANVGVWARSEEGYRWLEAFLSVDRLKELVPETAGLRVDRYTLPNLRSLNFVAVGLLGEGVASSTRIDPQAKGLGEYLRSRMVDLPEALLEDRSAS